MPEREIGSDFPFFLTSATQDFSDEWIAFHPPGRRFPFTSGRAALRAVTRVLGLNPSTPVMLPSYAPPEILIPFREMGAPISYYPVREDLTVDPDDIRKRCPRKTKALLVIHYFGFPQETAEIVSYCRQRGIYVIEDLAHAALTTVEGMPLGRFADFTINSFRKLLPLPDGALLTVADDRLSRLVERGRSVHAFMFGASRSFAMALRSAYESHPTAQLKRLSRYWFDLSEDYLVRDREPAMMSPLSQLLLTRINPHEVIRARRQNYLILINALAAQSAVKPLFPVLPDGVCPMGFPVTCASRETLREALAAERVTADSQWTLDPSVSAKSFPASRRLSQHILTLPCDQRYDLAAMRRMAGAVNDFSDSGHRMKNRTAKED